MSKKVTYGVAGLLDWTASIPVGKAHMRVHFSGGAITKYGTVPAEFTTSDPITQRIIEDSAYFCAGKIYVIRSVGTPDRRRPHRSAARTPETQDAPVASLPFDSALPDIPAPEAAAADSPQVVEMPCLEDAVEYMRERHAIPSVRMRTLQSLQMVARQHGITFKFPD